MNIWVQPFTLGMLLTWENFTKNTKAQNANFLYWLLFVLLPLLPCCWFCFMVITLKTPFDLSDRVNEYRVQSWKGWLEFWLKAKKIPLFPLFFLFALPTTRQPDMANHSVRWPFSAIATHTPTTVTGPSSHSCKLNPWCHFLWDDVMWWDCDCVAWRGVPWSL